MPVITIRGKLGSGAPEIGKMLADKLRWDYIDREILAQVASRLNLQENEVIAKEMPPVSLRERIEEALQKGYATGVGVQGAYLPISQIPLDDTRYLAALTTLIKELAQGRSVIYGRGSQFILREHPNTVNVSVVAPFKIRLKRVMESLKLNEDKAKQEMTRFDNAAREFLKRYFGAEMEDPTCYDIVVNTERLDYEMACTTIINMLRLKEPPPPKPQ
jgi:cytidylate kinase